MRCKCTPQRKRKLHLEQHHSFIHSLQLFEPLSTNRCRLKPCNTTDKTLILLEEPTRATIARTFAQNHRSRVGVQFTLKVSLILPTVISDLSHHLSEMHCFKTDAKQRARPLCFLNLGLLTRDGSTPAVVSKQHVMSAVVIIISFFFKSKHCLPESIRSFLLDFI